MSDDWREKFSEELGLPESIRLDIPIRGVDIYTLRIIFEDLLPRLCTHCAEKTREDIPHRHIKFDIRGMCHITRERIKEMREQPVGKVVGIK